MRSQRRKIDHVTRRLKGEVVETAVVEATWTRLCAAFRARLLGSPAKLAPILAGTTDPAVVKATIEAEIVQALDELSDEGFLRNAAGLEPSDPATGAEPA
jgi:hypothetical protein